MIPWTKSDLVKGTDVNTLTVRKVGDTYSLLLNGTLVHRMPFRPFFGPRVGFIVAKRSTLLVDFLRVSDLN